MRALAEYVMRDRKHAVFIALLFAVLPLCGWLTLAVISLVTLRKGAAEGLVVLGWAALPAAVIAVIGKPVPLVNDVILGSLIVWGMALVLRTTASWTATVQLVTLLLVSSLVVILVANPDIPHLWEQRLQVVLNKLDAAGVDASVPDAVLKQMVHDFSQIATGVYGTVILTGDIIGLMLGRWMQAQLYNPGGLKKELYHIRLNVITSLFLVMIVVGLLNGSLIALNAAMLVAVPFTVAGISLIHRATALTAYQTFWLISFYTVLILAFPYIIPLLVLIALIDSWIDIHKRLQLKKLNSRR